MLFKCSNIVQSQFLLLIEPCKGSVLATEAVRLLQQILVQNSRFASFAAAAALTASALARVLHGGFQAAPLHALGDPSSRRS